MGVLKQIYHNFVACKRVRRLCVFGFIENHLVNLADTKMPLTPMCCFISKSKLKWCTKKSALIWLTARARATQMIDVLWHMMRIFLAVTTNCMIGMHVNTHIVVRWTFFEPGKHCNVHFFRTNIKIQGI